MVGGVGRMGREWGRVSRMVLGARGSREII